MHFIVHSVLIPTLARCIHLNKFSCLTNFYGVSQGRVDFLQLMVKAHEEEVKESSSADMDNVQTEKDGVAIPKRGVIFKCDNLSKYKIICLGCIVPTFK